MVLEASRRARAYTASDQAAHGEGVRRKVRRAGLAGTRCNIDSIEYENELAQRAKKKFARWPEIKILEGDSQKILPELLKEISDPALFWLDAGYYGWAGVQGDKDRLTTELEAILDHQFKTHVILMDDARGLNGQNGAPTVEELKRRIELKVPRRKVEVKHDILRITLG